MTYDAAAHASLLDGVALRHELTALARGERNPDCRRRAALAHLKPRLRAARETIYAAIEDGTLSGMQAARALSGVQDTLLQVLYDLATKHFYYAQNPTESERIAIVAVGGYGRGTLAPWSDVDLLFVRPFKQTAWGESVIELVLMLLWDLGLSVGNAARSLHECVRLSLEDMTIRTAVLDARHVWGDPPLSRELRVRFRENVARGTDREFIDAKLAERDARHRRQGESRYLVEPNIKEGKGGLRDLQTLHWIARYLSQDNDANALSAPKFFTREEQRKLHAAESFFWNARCRLHCLAGRAEERLTFDVQPELAKRSGFAGENSRQAVERFMRAYFLVAKDVGDLTRIFCAAIEGENGKPRPAISRLIPGFLKLRGTVDEILVENGRLNIREGAFVRDPANLIRIFETADEKGLDIHPDALRTIARSLDLITDSVRHDPASNTLFLSILTSRHDPERTLRRMNEAGVLARFVPQFDHAVGLMQFNMYHHYTVDEHLIRAVGVLAAIERQELRDDHPLASDLIRRVKQRKALYCAVLLHDVAKGLGGSHSEIGAETAQSLCARWGLAPDDTATAVWLVRNHLVMSDTAQRRDITDPQTLNDFVAKVQSPERLRLLLILTVADIRAVGPGVWNAWKAQLLRQLYHEADAIMSGALASERPARIASAREDLSNRLAAWPKSEIKEALDYHRDNYWLAFDAEHLEHQARLKAHAKSNGLALGLHVAFDEVRGTCEVTICTPDHPGLFSELAGAIAACGGSIAEAKAFTADDGWVIDVFAVQSADNQIIAEKQSGRLNDTIGRAVRGEALPRPAVVRREGAHRVSVFDVRSRVTIDNDASVAASVIEVEGKDRPGLLSDLARAIFELNLSITSAIVATYGERAMDVFYVRDRYGQKVTHPGRRAAIESRLKEVFTGRT